MNAFSRSIALLQAEVSHIEERMPYIRDGGEDADVMMMQLGATRSPVPETRSISATAMQAMLDDLQTSLRLVTRDAAGNRAQTLRRKLEQLRRECGDDNSDIGKIDHVMALFNRFGPFEEDSETQTLWERCHKERRQVTQEWW